MALTLGAFFGVFGNLAVTIYFRARDKCEITKSDKFFAAIFFLTFFAYAVASILFIIKSF
ncbi:hypothetical protein SAMN04488696_1482 [Methanolobus profundi]|uniref:Uncharacterized protein n=2 Tax=Methanolobus profundi TaxID=487685 RepID=A0A1I4RCJ8_9EURY|nr:hypothetical protein SAMN04488696_1482 [Methanolobus profundi]